MQKLHLIPMQSFLLPIPAVLLAMSLLGGCIGRKTSSVATAPAETTTVSATGSAAQKDTAAAVVDTQHTHAASLSPATQLLINACDNYLSVNRKSPKTTEVLTIKASLYFNNNWFDSARSVYKRILDDYPQSNYAFESIRMIAQSFYEEKRFDEAGVWYKKLSEETPEGVDKTEAIARIAESIFRMAEQLESQSRFKDAAEQYERVAIEYPDARIADIALFNAGIDYEKQAEWSRAILVFQRLLSKYPESKLLPKTFFRIAKNHEKLLQWDIAAETYLRLAARFPSNELTPTALYNAGFSFENGGKIREAAATFEKMVQLFPKSKDAADVLFRAGELYGKVKDWDAVSRVTRIFTQRFGNDENRAIQALCMHGIALYMRNRNDEAVEQLTNVAATFKRMKNPGPMNTYYAAKALYTVAEINHTAMTAVALGTPRNQYKRQLAAKSDLLDKAVEAYVKVAALNIQEWTTRAIFQIGQAYEDFAIGIFSQDRPGGLSIDRRIAFELGIAEAVEKYFIEKALPFHERNVKLGIKEHLEDQYILQSRQKLTYLPSIAAENYLALVEITRTSEQNQQLDGFALIARKLQLFQKIAPFQERAISLFLHCLELGTTYQEFNDFYKKASEAITGISFNVGETYADVVSIARDAPIPEGFDDYERFVYKSKLLKQITGYEDQALENYLKTIKIAEAYKLNDLSVKEARNRIALVLFNRGRCYDLLCVNAFSRPPFPAGIDEAEKEEYRVRFEEIGLRYQEQAFDIYKYELDLAEQGYAEGDYVTHAYIRLYQNFPEEYGSKEEQMIQTAISSGSQWKVKSDSLPQWYALTFNDSAWSKAQRAAVTSPTIEGFPGNTPIPMWFGKGSPDTVATYQSFQTVYFRRIFSTDQMPHKAMLYLAANGTLDIYINGAFLSSHSFLPNERKTAVALDLMGKIRSGTNVLAIKAKSVETARALYPLVLLTIGTDVPLPKPPGFSEPMLPEKARVDVYVFPSIKNFTLEQSEARR